MSTSCRQAYCTANSQHSKSQAPTRCRSSFRSSRHRARLLTRFYWRSTRVAALVLLGPALEALPEPSSQLSVPVKSLGVSDNAGVNPKTWPHYSSLTGRMSLEISLGPPQPAPGSYGERPMRWQAQLRHSLLA